MCVTRLGSRSKGWKPEPANCQMLARMTIEECRGGRAVMQGWRRGLTKRAADGGSLRDL
jgi:hypothetical protein